MTKQKNLPPTKLIGGIRKDLLSLIKEKNTNCYLWNSLSDSRISSDADNLGLDAVGIKVKWIITPCSGVVSIERLQSLIAEKDNALEIQPEYSIGISIPDNDIIDLDEEVVCEEGENPLHIKIPEKASPTFKNALEELQNVHCKQKEKCEQLHYFVGVGSYVVDEKEYRGIHIIEPYKTLLGLQKKDSIMNQVFPLRRLLKSLV